MSDYQYITSIFWQWVPLIGIILAWLAGSFLVRRSRSLKSNAVKDEKVFSVRGISLFLISMTAGIGLYAWFYSPIKADEYVFIVMLLAFLSVAYFFNRWLSGYRFP